MSETTNTPVPVITPENFDPNNPALTAPNASSWVGEYLKAGSIVHLANFDLGTKGHRVRSAGGVALAMVGSGESEFHDAFDRAETVYGAGNVIDGNPLDYRSGEVVDDDASRPNPILALYANRGAYHKAVQSGKENPFADQPRVILPRPGFAGRIAARVRS